MADESEYDNFCSQFRDSLIKEASSEPGEIPDWFGRLVRYRGGNEYQMQDFFGETYGEKEFRQKLSNDEIKINVFEYTSPIVYTASLTDPTLATAVVQVHVEATIDGVKQTGDFTVTHKIRKAWQAYETKFE